MEIREKNFKQSKTMFFLSKLKLAWLVTLVIVKSKIALRERGEARGLETETCQPIRLSEAKDLDLENEASSEARVLKTKSGG